MSKHPIATEIMAEFVHIMARLGLDWWVSRRDRVRGVVTVIVAVEPGWVSPWIQHRGQTRTGFERYEFLAADASGARAIHAEWRP